MAYIRQDIITVAIFCYLEWEVYKVFKFHMKNSSYIEISSFLFQAPDLKCHPPITAGPHIFKIKMTLRALTRGNTVSKNIPVLQKIW